MAEVVVDRSVPVFAAANLAVLGLLVLVGAPGAAGLVAVAVVVPLATAVAERPQLGLLVLAALVPFDGLLLIVPHAGFVEGWKEFLVLLTFGATLFASPAARGPTRLPRPVWVSAAAALIGLALLSCLFVGGFQALIGIKVGFFYALVGVAAWRCPLDARERDRLVSILMAGGFATAVYGLLQQVMGGDRLNQLGYAFNETIRFSGDRLRSFSSFNQPFPFAFFLVLVILVGLPVALGDRARLRNQLFVISLPVLSLALASTVVRGAWLALAVGGGFLAAQRHRALFLLLPPALALMAFLPPDLASPAFHASSTNERVSSWRANISRVVDNPLGLGVGATGAAAEKSAGTGEDTYQPDNYYFKTVLELGLVGLWLLGLLYAGAFASTRLSAARLAGQDGALALGVAGSVASVAAASVVATYLEIFPMDLYFWLLLAVVARCDPESP
ncbi:MAG: O-antigen ligase family protein [Acidimicrobiales bacterium]